MTLAIHVFNIFHNLQNISRSLLIALFIVIIKPHIYEFLCNLAGWELPHPITVCGNVWCALLGKIIHIAYYRYAKSMGCCFCMHTPIWDVFVHGYSEQRIRLITIDLLYIRFRFHMMTSSIGNIFRVTGPLRGESISHRWISSEGIPMLLTHLRHNDVIKWKHFPLYWPFVWGIHRSPVISHHKGQWRGALMFSLICALNKQLSEHSWGWWFKMLSCSLWRHCNGHRWQLLSEVWNGWQTQSGEILIRQLSEGCLDLLKSIRSS